MARPSVQISDIPGLRSSIIRTARSVALASVGGSGSGGAVSSVFGRTGAVTAHSGDYTAAQVGAAATVHTHAQSDVTGLAASLSAKVDTSDSRLSDARTPVAHTHPWTDIASGKPTTLAGYGITDGALGTTLSAHTGAAAPHSGHALSVHTHAESDVTNLVSDLAGKAPTVHTHAQSDVTGLVAALAAKDPLVTRLKLTANPATIGTTAAVIAGFTTALAATTAYRFRAKIYYVCTVTTATLAARAAYSGTLGTAANGQSVWKVRGGTGVPTVWAATYKECTGLVNAAMPSATSGIGANGSAAIGEFEIEGVIFTNAAGNLTIEVIGSAATSITIQAGSQIEIWLT